MIAFFSHLPRCFVAMEARRNAHFRGRNIARPGHEVRLMPSVSVKPFVKRQKNVVADAEAIYEVATRSMMRFVPSNSKEVQGAPMIFRICEVLIRQRAQAIDALRDHLTGFGQIVPLEANAA